MRAALRIVAVAAMVTGCSPGVAGARGSKEPRLTVRPTVLASALTCYGRVNERAPAPIVFAPGTGATGAQVYVLGKGAFDVIGRPVCTVGFPHRTTADVQVSVQYLVWAIRNLSRRVGRPVVVAGVSQGGLLARIALTYWPSLRRRVTDVVTVAATHHGGKGSTASALTCMQQGCPPAIWQQGVNSHFLRALNNGRDETPGKLGWTTVRSATDEVVQPATGASPTSALKGATNILIQDVCPGRLTTHLGTVVDSVTIAALTDAVRHRGPAKVSRLPKDVCAHPYGTGLDETQINGFLALAAQGTGPGLAGLPIVRAEPPVRSWAKRR